MSEYQHHQTAEAMKQWRVQTLLGVFKPWLILIPFAIILRMNEIPHTGVCFRYREVFVFGIRIMRFQLGE